MISENDRDALIAYRFEQAKETIDLSRFLIDSKKLIRRNDLLRELCLILVSKIASHKI
jgi:hypothetical protein